MAKKKKLFTNQMLFWPNVVIETNTTIPRNAAGGEKERKKSTQITIDVFAKYWYWQSLCVFFADRRFFSFGQNRFANYKLNRKSE